MKKLFLVLLLSLGVRANQINIAVAANVSYAMDELKARFAKTHPDTNVRVTQGGSGKLTAQIKNGAPYGLFMAANMAFPEALYREGIAATKPVVYAQGTLAYLSVTPRDFGKGIALLRLKSIGTIAVANPKTAPYGTASVEAMKNGGVYDAVVSKLVYAESVSQTVAYTVTAADIGFVATSSLYSPQMARYKKNVNWARVDPKLYTPIEQGMVLLKKGEKNAEYKAFYDFILSDEARAVFRKYGYIVR